MNLTTKLQIRMYLPNTRGHHTPGSTTLGLEGIRPPRTIESTRTRREGITAAKARGVETVARGVGAVGGDAGALAGGGVEEAVGAFLVVDGAEGVDGCWRDGEEECC